MGFLDIGKKLADPFGLVFDDKKTPKVPNLTDIWKVNKKTGLNLTDEQLAGVTGYYGKSLPAFMDLASQYAPGFIKQGFDFGNLAMGGFEGLQTEAGGRAADTMANLRAKELGLTTGQAGGVRGLMESLSPEQAAAVAQANQTAAQAQGLESDFMGRAGGMIDQYGSQVGQYDPTISGTNADVTRATQMAQEAFARRGSLSPEEQRSAQQQAREAFSASGRLGGNAAIAAEIQNREAAKAARRGEAAAFGQQAFTQQLGAAGQQLAAEQALFNQGIAGGAQRTQERQLGFNQRMDIENQRSKLRDEAAQAGVRSYEMAGGFYTKPGLELFKTTPESYTAGTNLANIGLNLGKSMSPDLDYNLPLNLALGKSGAMDQRSLEQFKLEMEQKAAQDKMISDLIGTAGMFAMSASDRRVKTNIKQIGITDGGLPVFTYTYKGDNVTRMGVMAQDVEKVHPEAVREFNGLKAVDYSLIK
jgi:hypothetical protein